MEPLQPFPTLLSQYICFVLLLRSHTAVGLLPQLRLGRLGQWSMLPQGTVDSFAVFGLRQVRTSRFGVVNAINALHLDRLLD